MFKIELILCLNLDKHQSIYRSSLVFDIHRLALV